jgi:hypothetical protein
VLQGSSWWIMRAAAACVVSTRPAHSSAPFPPVAMLHSLDKMMKSGRVYGVSCWLEKNTGRGAFHRMFGRGAHVCVVTIESGETVSKTHLL